MAGRGQTIDPTIRAAVRAAVREADGRVSRTDIVKRFLVEGVSKAALYGWIARDIEEMATGIVVESRGGLVPVAPSIIKMATTAMAQDAPAANYYDILDKNLRDCDAAIAMSKTEDGRIRNSRLLLAALAEIRKTVVALSTMRDERAIHTFLVALTDAVKPEGQEVWERVAGRMRAINQAHGYF